MAEPKSSASQLNAKQIKYSRRELTGSTGGGLKHGFFAAGYSAFELKPVAGDPSVWSVFFRFLHNVSGDVTVLKLGDVES